jgi:hypothetical protein
LSTPSTAVRSPDPSKSETVVAIRQARTRLTALSLRRLKEGVFRLELQLIEAMVTDGVDLAKVQTVASAARCIEVLDVLQVTARER